MSAKHWLGSPLAGTAGVLAGLCLLSIPLRQLTSAPPVSASSVQESHSSEIPAVLRIKLLAPAQRLSIKTPEGKVLLDIPQPPMGESEHDVLLRFADGDIALVLTADFGNSAAETAVFLTVMPDGREEQTRYAIGSGLVEETLRYDWQHEH